MGVAILITIINIRGAKTASILQTVLTAIIAIAGILLVVGSAVNGDAGNITGQMWESGAGNTLGSVFKVACMTPFLFIGFDVIPQAAEEIDVPYKKIGKLGKNKTPGAAIILCGIACVAAPFFGRGVLVWLVDAASFGCVIAYMFVSISFCILRKKKPEMERPYKVKAGGFVGAMAVIMAGFMTLLYIIPASFSAALVWQEWVVVGIWLALGVFFYFYSKKKYGEEFGRDIFIVDETKTAPEEPVALPDAKYPDRHFVITVGCEYGSGSPEIARMVADYFGIEYYDRDLVDKVVQEIGVDKGLVEEADTRIGVRYAFDTSYGVRYANLSNRVIDAQFQAIHEFAKNSCVIVGRSSDYILKDSQDVMNIFIYAPKTDEIAAVMKKTGLNQHKAEEEWENVEKSQHARHEYITGKKRGDRHTCDVLLNSSLLGWDATAQFIEELVERKFNLKDDKEILKEV